MRLSEKGLDKVYGLEFEDVEFDQEDFTGVVILTLDEAKELALKLMSNDEFFFRQTGEFDYYTEALWNCLTDKIEQAEGKL